MRKLTRNKKGAGAFGFDEATTALIALMVLVVTGVLATIILNSFDSAPGVITANQVTVKNETAWLNATNYTLTGASGATNFAITSVINITSGAVIPAANYSIIQNGTQGVSEVINSSTTYQTTGAGGTSITYTYWLNNAPISNVVNNTTGGLASFFGNVSTWLTLISVTIIVLIVVTVIVVLRRSSETASRAPGNRNVPEL